MRYSRGLSVRPDPMLYGAIVTQLVTQLVDRLHRSTSLRRRQAPRPCPRAARSRRDHQRRRDAERRSTIDLARPACARCRSTPSAPPLCRRRLARAWIHMTGFAAKVPSRSPTLDVGVFEAVVGSGMPVLAECSSGLSSRCGGWPCRGCGCSATLGSGEDVPSAAMVCLLCASCVLTHAYLCSPPLDCSCVIIVVGEDVWAHAGAPRLAIESPWPRQPVW